MLLPKQSLGGERFINIRKIWSNHGISIKVFKVLFELPLQLARVFNMKVTHNLPIEQLQRLHDLVLLFLECQISKLKLPHVDHVFDAVSHYRFPLVVVKYVVF